LTVYFGERARVEGTLLADVLLDLCARHSIRLSVLMRGVQGFGPKHRLRSDRLLTLSEDLPLVAMAVDAEERIEALAHEVGALDAAGLLTIERARFADDGRCVPTDTAGEPAATLGPVRARMPEQLKLTVCVGRHERVDGEPAFAHVCRLLHDAGVAGASVLLGVDGTVEGERRRARFLARNRGVPMLVVSFGERAAIERALGMVAAPLPSALSLIERAHVCKRDGRLLTANESGYAPTGVGSRVSAKLTVVTSGAAHRSGRPVHLELIRRLRQGGAAGATSLRGVWGFHGNHPPHGDRLLSLRRHVPVITELIDTSPRVDELFAIADELTREAGLVTRELVPVCGPLSGRGAL
jgi:PII-like signaling protein